MSKNTIITTSFPICLFLSNCCASFASFNNRRNKKRIKRMNKKEKKGF